MSTKKAREIRIFQSDAYLSLDFMNQAGHLVTRVNGQLTKQELPIEKAEPLKVELASFLDCVTRAKVPKVDVVLGRTALEVAIEVTRQIKAGWGK